MAPPKGDPSTSRRLLFRGRTSTTAASLQNPSRAVATAAAASPHPGKGARRKAQCLVQSYVAAVSCRLIPALPSHELARSHLNADTSIELGVLDRPAANQIKKPPPSFGTAAHEWPFTMGAKSSLFRRPPSLPLGSNDPLRTCFNKTMISGRRIGSQRGGEEDPADDRSGTGTPPRHGRKGSVSTSNR
jgi:hypothetical protein